MDHGRPPSRRERGSALVEFLLSSLVWVPLLLGTVFIGINVTRAISVAQICRDAGHMYAYGIDFSQSANQKLLARLSSDFTLTSGGNGVVIFSTILLVGASDCEAAGLPADASQCTNLNQPVFTRRLVVGNGSLRSSNFGSPRGGAADSNGNISNNTYLRDASTRAAGFTSVLPMLAGQNAYLTEAYFASPDLDHPGFLSGSGNYSRAIF